jgi:hypothetical protein
VREAGADVDLKSPMALARALRMTPTEVQKRIFTDLYRARVFMSKLDDNEEITRALTFCLLWQTLAIEGSKGTVLASEDGLGRKAMGFLRNICLRTHPKLADISNCEPFGTIQFGVDAGWNIKLIDCDPVKAQKRGFHSRCALILGERSSETAFVESLNALVNAMDRPGTRIMRLW